MSYDPSDVVAGGDLPPSAKYVYRVLDEHGGLSRQELLEETGLNTSTLDRAVATLQDQGYLLKTRQPGDLRQVVLNTQHPTSSSP